jgi:hypothetical protein
LFVVENKKFSYFFDRRKNGFYNSTNKKHPVEGGREISLVFALGGFSYEMLPRSVAHEQTSRAD